jgi:plastocyanin
MEKSGSGFMKGLVTLIIVGMLLSPVSCTSVSDTADLTAEDGAFSESIIRVRAGEEVTIVFENKDNVPHNLAVYETEAATKAIFIGEIITGPKTITYKFTAPSYPGIYFFRCDVHPETMTGDFIVSGTSS